jgi:hypothetical protein
MAFSASGITKTGFFIRACMAVSFRSAAGHIGAGWFVIALTDDDERT